jgi:hypothetical protein
MKWKHDIKILKHFNNLKSIESWSLIFEFFYASFFLQLPTMRLREFVVFVITLSPSLKTMTGTWCCVHITPHVESLDFGFD